MTSYVSIIMAVLCLVVTDASVAMKVVVDPGHGGVDGGASTGSVREADIALKVGLLLKEKLLARKFDVAMTRTQDKSLSLEQRVQMADKANGDVLVSLHVNSNPNRSAKGFEIYFQNQLPPDEEMLFLAANEEKVSRAKIAEIPESEIEPSKKKDVLSIIEDLHRQHRMKASHQLSLDLNAVLKDLSLGHKEEPVSIKQAPFYVVSNGNRPSVLVELGFLTNSKNAEKLANSAYQAEIAEKITQGLLKYRDELLSGQVKSHSLE